MADATANEPVQTRWEAEHVVTVQLGGPTMARRPAKVRVSWVRQSFEVDVCTYA